jgi:hypothetical protein
MNFKGVMRDRAKRPAQFVVCVDNTSYPASLELHKIYRAVPDPDAAADGDIRVVDESGEDYLYPGSYFTPITLPVAVKRSLRKAEQAGCGEARVNASVLSRASMAQGR